MRNATLLTVGSSLLAVFIVAACASSETAVPQPTPEPEPTDDTPPPSNPPTTKPAPKADAAPEASAKQCVAKCTSDMDCQNSCPAAPAGVNCCDLSTGACYANSNSTCPKTQDDGGTTPAY